VDIDKLISDKEFWTTTKVCVKVLLPAVKVLRFSDGMRGGNLGLMYNLLLQLDELYSSRIDGAPDFCKQVGSFPHSRYDRGLQASSRILPT